MSSFLHWAIVKWQVDIKLWVTYCITYFVWGLGMNWIGQLLEIAQFTYWWQVITCYVLYMVPISLLLKDMPFQLQYAYGLIAMGLLEFLGYTFQTSYAYPNNILDQLFGIRNFSLGMALFFALYFPLGNTLVGALYRLIGNKAEKIENL
ncbi:MAG: hypothetical protein AAGF77_01490 [Bacteroidota bacterium]